VVHRRPVPGVRRAATKEETVHDGYFCGPGDCDFVELEPAPHDLDAHWAVPVLQRLQALPASPEPRWYKRAGGAPSLERPRRFLLHSAFTLTREREVRVLAGAVEREP
jgi:hypothetical protein